MPTASTRTSSKCAPSRSSERAPRTAPQDPARPATEPSRPCHDLERDYLRYTTP
jgi:hypothetical protein